MVTISIKVVEGINYAIARGGIVYFDGCKAIQSVCLWLNIDCCLLGAIIEHTAVHYKTYIEYGYGARAA